MATMAAPALGPTTTDPQRRGVGFLEDALLRPGHHRVQNRRRTATRDTFLQVVTGIATLCAILTTRARQYGWTVGALVAFTVAGFTVSTTRGWIVAGVALAVMEWRTRE